MKRLLLLFVVGLWMIAPIYAIGETTPIAPTEVPQLTPDEALEKASEHLFSGEYTEAVDTLSALLQTNPDIPEAYFLRAYAYRSLARYSLALDDFTRAITLVPWDWSFYAARGDTYAVQGEFGEAIFDYNTAIDLNPRYTIGYYNRADLLNASNQPEKAAWDFNIAQALSEIDSGNSEGGIEALRAVVDTIPNTERRLKAYVYYNLALAEFGISDYKSAMSDSTNATEYFSDMHDIYLLRGTLYRFDNALELAGKDFYRRITLLQKKSETLAYNDGLTVLMDYGVVYNVTFDAQAGDTYEFLVQDLAESGVDALIAILDPQGNPIAGDDDGGVGVQALDSAVTNLVLPADGTYTLVVSHANGGFVGELAVTIEKR